MIINNAESSFEVFWSVYPRRVAKQAAFLVWKKLAPTPELVAIIVAAVERQRRTIWRSTESQFIPHASTWLNGRRWEDEIDDPEERQNQAQEAFSREAERQAQEELPYLMEWKRKSQRRGED
jgi:hypothetical protein